MSHHCSSLLIHCMDFRLIEKTMDWMKEKNLIGDCDIISLAGASKVLAGSEDIETKKFILKQMEISYNLHHMRKVFLLHHSDCGAYKADNNFASIEEDIGLTESVLVP